MARVLILAKSSREAGSYAHAAGIPVREYRAVNKAAGIRGIRKGEIHLLPSFLTRPDRHAIMAELRWARTEIFYVDPADFPDDQEPSEPTNEIPDPVATEEAFHEADMEKTEKVAARQLEAAYRYNAIRNATRDAALEEFRQSELVGASDDEPEKRVRRKKCPKCDELFPKDEFGAHLATHEDEDEPAPTTSYFD